MLLMWLIIKNLQCVNLIIINDFLEILLGIFLINMINTISNYNVFYEKNCLISLNRD